MLLSGNEIHEKKILTPSGEVFTACIENIERCSSNSFKCEAKEDKVESLSVCCSVKKDGGDDPDVTSGLDIYARVTLIDEGITIEGGEGVGIVTKPGLDQRVGEAAINSVPRRMICEQLKACAAIFDYTGGFKVVIYVPGGLEIAEKTFNPRLGIEGGISIIGTSGVVEPMSEKALIDTIRVELKVLYESGAATAVIAPGNYGIDFLRQNYNYDIEKAVKCSNYIGETIDMAAELGFERIVLLGHIGKLVKLAGGIMNTHSKEADCRMELIAANAIGLGFGEHTLTEAMASVTTEAALEILKESNKNSYEKLLKRLSEKIGFHLNKRAAQRLEIEYLVYSGELGELCRSERVKWYIS